MGIANSILVVSENQEDISGIHSKLVPLRDVDSIISATLTNAVEACRKYIPDAVIVFVAGNDERLFDICKGIRQDQLLKNTPIMIILDVYDSEFLISSFDAGINDYLIKPAKDTDILMKVIWLLQRSEFARELERKDNLLKEMNIVDANTGVYTPDSVSRVVLNEVNLATKYKYSLSLMVTSLDDNGKNRVNDATFAMILKRSTRNSDIICNTGNGRFYIILPRTAENGVSVVYKKIKSNLGGDFTLVAGAVEAYSDVTAEKIISSAENAYTQASSGQEKFVVIKD